MVKITNVYQGNPDITSVIRDVVLKQVVPERSDEIDLLFEKLQVRSEPGITGYRTDYGFNTVFLSDQTLIINLLITKLFYEGILKLSFPIFKMSVCNENISVIGDSYIKEI